MNAALALLTIFACAGARADQAPPPAAPQAQAALAPAPEPEKWNLVELAVGGGSAVFHSGALGDLAKPDASILIDLYGYPFSNPHHGFFLGGVVDYLGNKNPQALSPIANGSIYPNPVLPLVAVGYSFRWALEPGRWYLSYDIGPAAALFATRPAGQVRGEGSLNFALFDQLNLDFLFQKVRTDKLAGDLSLGLTLFHGWVPNGHDGSVGVSGNTFGLGLRLKVGG